MNAALHVLFDLLQRFQTAIVEVVGFAGVILALLTNARIARAGRRKMLAVERRTIRTALIEELKIIKLSYVEGAESIRISQESEDCLVPTSRIDALFKANASKIGLLSSDEVEKVLDAYLCHDGLHIYLSLIAKPLPGAEHFLKVPAARSRDVAAMYDSMAAKVEAAIDTLEAGRKRTITP